MATFALITEGLTDQIAIEHIIEHICGEMFEDGVDINPLQPLRDATDSKHAPHGGWERVLEFCNAQAATALEANDFVVIHIDTDEGEHKNFGLALKCDGNDRDHEAIVRDARDIIIKRIGVELHEKFKDRFVFAISVHSMESWILLCLCKIDSPRNSLYKLNEFLKKNDIKPIYKSGDDYTRVMRLVKGKMIKAIPENNSLYIFVESLKTLMPHLD